MRFFSSSSGGNSSTTRNVERIHFQRKIWDGKKLKVFLCLHNLNFHNEFWAFLLTHTHPNYFKCESTNSTSSACFSKYNFSQSRVRRLVFVEISLQVSEKWKILQLQNKISTRLNSIVFSLLFTGCCNTTLRGWREQSFRCCSFRYEPSSAATEEGSAECFECENYCENIHIN